jgi:DNA-binding transcriptional LysR family regulator
VRLTLRQLEYFVAVSESGSITAAAQVLYLSPSTISTSVAELETVLGVRLFTRHSRGLSLTGEGRSVLANARMLLRDAQDLVSGAGALAGELSGTLSVGCYSTITPLLIPLIVSKLSERFPKLTVEFSEGSRSELLEGFSTGKFDIVVIYNYPFKKDLPDQGSVISLGALPPYVLFPLSHPAVGTGRVKLADLDDLSFILFDLEPADQYFLSILDKEGVSPRIKHRTGDFEVIRGLVAQGLGYSLLTQRTRHSVSYEGTRYATAELELPSPPLEVVALVPAASHLTARAEIFIDVSREIFSDVVEYENLGR